MANNCNTCGIKSYPLCSVCDGDIMYIHKNDLEYKIIYNEWMAYDELKTKRSMHHSNLSTVNILMKKSGLLQIGTFIVTEDNDDLLLISYPESIKLEHVKPEYIMLIKDI